MEIFKVFIVYLVHLIAIKKCYLRGVILNCSPDRSGIPRCHCEARSNQRGYSEERVPCRKETQTLCFKIVTNFVFWFDQGRCYSFIFCNEVFIPLMSEELKPWCSISFSPTMVQPCGVVTLSINCSGCTFSSRSILAAPFAV